MMDHDKAVFADPTKVRRIEYSGEFFKSRGPLNVTRSPQNGYAILQAGTSAKGQDFAAKYADAIFAIQPRAHLMLQNTSIQLKVDVRPRDATQIPARSFWHAAVIGSSEAEALERQDEHIL